jgi:hypothetical protein
MENVYDFLTYNYKTLFPNKPALSKDQIAKFDENSGIQEALLETRLSLGKLVSENGLTRKTFDQLMEKNIALGELKPSELPKFDYPQRPIIDGNVNNSMVNYTITSEKLNKNKER